MLGLILPADETGFGEPFFAEFLAGVGEEASTVEQHLLLTAHPPGSTAERETYLKVVRGGWVDGVILIRLRWEDARVDLLRGAGFPFVAFGRTNDVDGYPFIDEDSVAGLGILVDHLVQLGHSKIAFVRGPDDITFARHRLTGFETAMTSHRLPVPDRYLLSGDLRRESGAEAMSELMDQTHPPTAVIFCNDMMALGGMEEAVGRGVVVGRDVSIAGFDGIGVGGTTAPGLTTLRQPIQEIGRRLCRILLEHIDDDTRANRHVLLVPEILVRGSTGPAPTPRRCGVTRSVSERREG